MEKDNQKPESTLDPEAKDKLHRAIEEDGRIFKANPDFLLREVAGEAVLIPVGGEVGVFENTVISLNDTCSFLWKLFQKPMRIADAVAEAEAEYSDPNGELEQGVYSFVREYVQYGLLKEELK